MPALDPATAPCVLCGGARHVRDASGWRRCVCVTAILSNGFVSDILRRKEHAPPAGTPTIPFQTTVYTGSWDQFRWRAWATLMPYAESGLTYQTVVAQRLTEMYFERDPDPTTIRDLEVLDLLIVVLGSADLPNSYTAKIVTHLLNLRSMGGRPTWIYTPFMGNTLAEAYGKGDHRAQELVTEVAKHPLVRL